MMKMADQTVASNEEQFHQSFFEVLNQLMEITEEESLESAMTMVEVLDAEGNNVAEFSERNQLVIESDQEGRKAIGRLLKIKGLSKSHIRLLNRCLRFCTLQVGERGQLSFQDLIKLADMMTVYPQHSDEIQAINTYLLEVLDFGDHCPTNVLMDSLFKCTTAMPVPLTMADS